MKLLWFHATLGRALPKGVVTAQNVFADRTNLAAIRRSPDYTANLIS
jgi:hypothetical protein